MWVGYFDHLQSIHHLDSMLHTEIGRGPNPLVLSDLLYPLKKITR